MIAGQEQDIAVDELREAAWEYAAARVFPEDLPMIAAQALAAGADSPALRELAGLGRLSDPTTIRELYAAALSELAIEQPSPEQAARRDVYRLADDVVSGRKSPREAARLCMVSDFRVNGEAESAFVELCCYIADNIDDATAEYARVLAAELVEFARDVVA
jgi:hypothetical protein